MDLGERISGCLLGGVLGDVVGAPYEGQAPPLEVSWNRDRWSITDDSQLTLATCAAIVDGGGVVDPARIAAVFASWFQARRFSGLGASTMKALRELAVGGHWALVGAKGDNAGGNGAAMRIAPIACVVDPRSAEGRRTIRDVSRITHHHDEAYAGALAIAIAVDAALFGRWAGEPGLMNEIASQLPDSVVRDRMSPREFPSGVSGFAADSVPAAIMIAERHSHDLRHAIEQAVVLGGDTDTVASMVGQIVGALRGSEEVHRSLVFGFPAIEKTIDEFSRCVRRVPRR